MEIGAKIVQVKSCLSTNDVAKDLALSGEEEGTVVISEEQTQGKGTKGRSWYSARKKGLYLSVVLYPPRPDISLLPLVAGVALSEAVSSSFGIRVRLKWPNDLVWEGKKLGGILCESAFSGDRINYAVLGIGLNLSHVRDDFPEEIRDRAVSLKLISKEELDEKALLGKLWQSLNHWYGQFRHEKGDRIISAYQEISVLSPGKKVVLDTDRGEISGIYSGISVQGGLVLESEGKKKTYFSSEITAVKDSHEEG
jgi:BirA family biotin operon repressor/biotin-[acetyl-CoA-carboxylase] ligase